jgi:toxin CcdB
MARFDVYRNKAGNFPPLLMQIQSELHDDLRSCVMVPLVPAQIAENRRPERLMPAFIIHNELYVMVTQEMGSMPSRHIGQYVDTLASEQHTITSAIDFLLEGF